MLFAAVTTWPDVANNAISAIFVLGFLYIFSRFLRGR